MYEEKIDYIPTRKKETGGRVTQTLMSRQALQDREAVERGGVRWGGEMALIYSTPKLIV